ncbi:MAG: COG1361 S-layer family protein [Candidatus Methanomethylicaceae archaeon]
MSLYNPPLVASAPPNLNVTLDNTSLIPGANNRIYVTIKNTGDVTASQIWVALSLPSSASGGALMVLNGSDGRWYIDSLASSESTFIPVVIYVSPSAAGGLYQLTFTLSYQYYGSRTETRTVGVYVQLLDVIGASLSASITPYELKFGENNALLKIKNLGDADARLVTISIIMPGATSGTSPLSLLNSDGKWNFDLIGVNDEVSLPLTIYAAPSSAGQIYQMSVSLSYSDYIRSKSETRYLTLVVPFSSSPSVNFETQIIPQDLKAGEVNNLRIQLYNKGDSDATYIQVVLNMPPSGTAGLPLVLQGSDGRWLIDRIRSGESVTLNADVYVSPSASGGAYQSSITLTYYDALSRSKQEMRYFAINVPAVFSPMTAIDVSLSKNELRSGETNDLNIIVKNMGDGEANSLTVSVTLPGAQSVTAPMALIGSDGSWYIGKLQPGESVVIPIKIFASPSASGSVTSMVVTTSYTDAYLKSKQQTNYLGLIVRGTVDLVILDTSTYPSQITLGKPFSITVSIINLGTTTAQSVVIMPETTQNLQPLGEKIFLGDLAVNVPSSFTLSYTATNITSGVYTLNLEHSYRDSLGQKLTGYLNVPVNIVVGSQNIASTTTSTYPSSLFVWYLPYVVVMVSVIIVGVVYFKRRRS